MKISDFDYDLPESSIAFYPPKVRGTTKLVVLDRETGTIAHKRYPDFVQYVEPGDIVVLNNTKVIKARLLAVNSKNQPRELLLIEKHQGESSRRHKALFRGKLTAGETLFVDKIPIKIEQLLEGGIALFSSDIGLDKLAADHGLVPLPPYIKRDASEADVQRYQTEFAKAKGSLAAPTASLNFTKELIAKLETKGAKVVYVTLHVGLGTFLPIREVEIEKHHMHSEYFEIPSDTIQAIVEAIRSDQKIFAVGTTVARTLEYAVYRYPELVSGPMPATDISGEANIFIYPGYQFKIVDALLTNFHAPRSTVLMMAAAFAGWDNLKKAYGEALAYDYKFLSYGDSMLIL